MQKEEKSKKRGMAIEKGCVAHHVLACTALTILTKICKNLEYTERKGGCTSRATLRHKGNLLSWKAVVSPPLEAIKTTL